MAQIFTSYSDAEFKEVLSEQVKEVFSEIIKSNQSARQDGGGKETSRYKTREETGRYFNVSLTTLHYWEKAGILIPDRIGRRVLYSEEVVEAAIKKQRGQSL